MSDITGTIIEGDELFFIEHQAGAGSQWSMAGDKAEVKKIISSIMRQPSNNQVAAIYRVEVTQKYTAELELKKVPYKL